MKTCLLLIFLIPALPAYSQKWEKNFDYVDNCVCRLAKVKKAGKVGYVDKDGKEIIKLQYDDGLTFEEGYTSVKAKSKMALPG